MDKEKTVSASFSQQLVAVQAALRLHILLHLGDPMDTDDVLQATNLYLIERSATFNPDRGEFVAWAREMANHQIRKFRLEAKRERLVFDEDTMALMADEIAAEPPPPEDLRVDALRTCLAKLEPEQREHLFLRHIDGKSLPWLCEHFGTSYQGEASRLKRICKKLHDCIMGKVCEWGHAK